MSTTRIIGKSTTVDIFPNGVFYTGGGSARFARFKKMQKIEDVQTMMNNHSLEIKTAEGEVLMSIPKTEFPDYDELYNEIVQAWRLFWFH